MRALQVAELGEPEQVLGLVEVERPSPGPGQVLVKVLAAPASFPDVLMARGHYQVRPPLPFTPGVEACGEIVELGADVTGFAVGDRVLGVPDLPHGGFADYALMPTASAFLAPHSLDDAEAASMHIGYQTAWFGLHRLARLQPGETVLIHAAAGGTGSAAVQLAKAAGARVIAVVGGADKAQIAAELGADLVVDRLRDDVIATVKQDTAPHGVDVVYDPVGGEAFTASTKVIAFEGRIVVVGFTSGQIPTPALNHALVKNYSILGLHWGLYNTHNPAAVAECHRELTRLADAGQITPLVSDRVDFAGLPAAVQAVAEGRTTGRVVLIP